MTSPHNIVPDLFETVKRLMVKSDWHHLIPKHFSNVAYRYIQNNSVAVSLLCPKMTSTVSKGHVYYDGLTKLAIADEDKVVTPICGVFRFSLSTETPSQDYISEMFEKMNRYVDNTVGHCVAYMNNRKFMDYPQILTDEELETMTGNIYIGPIRIITPCNQDSWLDRRISFTLILPITVSVKRNNMEYDKASVEILIDGARELHDNHKTEAAKVLAKIMTDALRNEADPKKVSELCVLIRELLDYKAFMRSQIASGKLVARTRFEFHLDSLTEVLETK